LVDIIKRIRQFEKYCAPVLTGKTEMAVAFKKDGACAAVEFGRVGYY
jgi:hypothetical protein